MKVVHISSKVQSRIESLKKSGKAGIVLAQKAVSIIGSLTSGAARHHMDAIGSFTKYGRETHQELSQIRSGMRLPAD